MVIFFTSCLIGKIYLYQYTNSKACKYLCSCDIFDRFCPYTTPTSTETLSSAHQKSENSDRQQPRPASCGGGCGCWSPYTGNLVEVAVGNCGCSWKLLSCMGPLNTNFEHFNYLVYLTPSINWKQRISFLSTEYYTYFIQSLHDTWTIILKLCKQVLAVKSN